MNDLLKVKEVTKIYKEKQTNQLFSALKEVSFTIYDQEMVGIIGESGCGKSTLLRLIVGLEELNSGKILYRNKNIAHWLKEERLAFRQQVQIIFQNPYEIFDERKTISQILLQPLRIHKIGDLSKERELMIRTVMERSGFEHPENYLDRHPRELSGGQLQRISILRSLILNPRLVVADEPVSMLDAAIRSEVLDIFYQANQERGTTIVIVSHDIVPLIRMTHRLIVMKSGQIVEIIPSDRIYDTSVHPYTKLLLANANGEEVDSDKMDMLNREFLDRMSKFSGSNMVEVGPGHFVFRQALL